MKALQAIVVLIVILAMGYAGWWYVSRRTDAIPTPAQVLGTTPVKVDETFTVESNHQASWTFAPPVGKSPGLLEGRWMCQGKSAGIHGAADDTLIAFKLLDPNNNVLQAQPDHPVQGNFSVRCDGTGNLTFIFDNTGIIRSSSRQIHLEGTYRPD
jgi:hypothetical protein